jgi:hypothetical protein
MTEDRIAFDTAATERMSVAAAYRAYRVARERAKRAVRMYQEPNAQGEETKKRAKRGPELLPIPLDGFVCV